LPEAGVIARIIPDFLRRRARALGAAIRLGCDLSGRSSALLARSRIALEDGKFVLSTEPRWADMLLGEQTRRRAQAVASALNASLEIKLAS
jgi:exopolyphosphatase/guanosine-5'-triphosphate,3'-diphosphate pyrophosphatase